MNKSYKEIKAMYDNATDDEERGNALCLLTENYLFGDIERREIEDYLAEQCPEIMIEDYLDEECVWEMLGLSEEEYLQSLDEQTNHNVSVKVGDIVIFDLNAHYENKDMRYLVRTNHRFLIMDVSDKDDNFVCELEGCTMDDFKDEWGRIDEDELYNTIREEEALNKTMADLAEMNTL